MTQRSILQGSQYSILLSKYAQEIESTDNLSSDDLRPVLLGLFGEVGSVMATAKKRHREDKVYTEYENAVKEEFGDVLWYFTALCRRLDQKIEEIFAQTIGNENYENVVAASDLTDGPVSCISIAKDLPSLDEILFKLGEATATLLTIEQHSDQTETLLCAFANQYLQAIQVARVPFAQIAQTNIDKARGRFSEIDFDNLPNFDEQFPEEERLPKRFEIKIAQRESGKSYLQWNGVYIGDPLTDNIRDPDGYRFHDVFHLAYAAILHWSPIFRGLIKQKRKSDPQYDEMEDGGRAKVVEEGLTAWIFSYAKDLEFFENQTSLPFDLLKTVQRFVRGYEVDACRLNLWEYAILESYKVFRQVRKYNGGIVIGDREKRAITYKPIIGD